MKVRVMKNYFGPCLLQIPGSLELRVLPALVLPRGEHPGQQRRQQDEADEERHLVRKAEPGHRDRLAGGWRATGRGG